MIKVVLFLMLFILVIDFKEVIKILFVLKLKVYLGKVYIVIVVGIWNVGYLKSYWVIIYGG